MALRYPVRDPRERHYERGAEIAQNKIVGISGGGGLLASKGVQAGALLPSSITEEGVDDGGDVFTVFEFLTEMDSTEDPTTQLS